MICLCRFYHYCVLFFFERLGCSAYHCLRRKSFQRPGDTAYQVATISTHTIIVPCLVIYSACVDFVATAASCACLEAFYWHRLPGARHRHRLPEVLLKSMVAIFLFFLFSHVFLHCGSVSLVRIEIPRFLVFELTDQFPFFD